MLPVLAGLAVLEKVFQKVASNSEKAENGCAKLKNKCKQKRKKIKK